MAKDTEEQTTETDETVEQESTDNQENEESGETEEESTEEQSEESDSSAEDDSEDNVLDFSKAVNVDKLPPELKATGKKMLSELTKRSQALKKRFDGLNERLGTEYSAHIIKSKALDKLQSMPDFQRFLTDLDSGRGYGASVNGNRKRDEEDEESENGSEKVTLTKREIEKMIASGISNSVKPLYDERHKQNVEWAQKNLKNFNKYRPAITDAISKFPGMSLVEAYNFVTREDAIAEAKNGTSKRDEEDVEKLRKKPRTEKSSTSKSDQLTPTDIKTLRGSIEWAAKQQKTGASKT